MSGRDIGPIGLRDALFRLGSSLFMGFAGVVALPSPIWPAVWFMAAVLVQLAAFVIGEPMRRNPDQVVSRSRRAAHSVTLGLSALVFAAAGPMFWFLGGWGAGLFALFMLAGAAMHVVVRSSQDPKQLWICISPFLVQVAALPLISFFAAAPDERSLMGVIALAAVLLAARIAAAALMSIASARRTQLALEQAQHERARAEAASAAKGDFLDLMGHELRTPLNGVLGMAQAMSGAELPPEQRRRLDVIRASGEALLLLVNDVLEFARVGTDELEFDCGVVEPPALAAEMEASFALLAEARGITLDVTCLPSAGEQRAGDPRRVRQIMRSLAGIALKSTDAGVISIVVCGDADELRVEVAGGFAADSPILAEAGAAPAAGARIVLGVARDLARRMGGDLTVVAEPHGDATLVVRMALPLQAGALDAGLVSTDASSPGEDFRLRVLAAEDNPTNQLVLKTLLEQAGLAVHIVGDGEEAVAAWDGALWDVVLMDIRMPRMDGVAATRAIRALEAAEGRARTPILAVTADAMAHQTQQYIDAGMDGLIAKPIQFAELAAVVAAAATRGRTQAAPEAFLSQPAA